MTFFETIKCYDEEIFNLKWHQQRIAKAIGLNINLQDYIYPPNTKLLKCKIIYNDSGILDISYFKYIPRETNSFKLIFDDTIDYKYKRTDRKKLDNLFNQKGNADEIIIIKNGFVSDTSIANIAIFQNGIWVTPKLPLLKGTCRNRLIEEKIIFEKNITIKELLKSQKIALMNSMIDFKIISNFDIIYSKEILEKK